MTGFRFDNSYARDLAGLYVAQNPLPMPAPYLVRVNMALALQLGLNTDELTADLLCGTQLPLGAQPLAQAYAGHQFGHFSPSLGDGRALLLGEHLAPNGCRYDVALKGSGPTPFARQGDGLAALGPVLREYLVSEAMQALGIPTTRALGVVTTGMRVPRKRIEQGAVLTRIAASHIRIGTFQFFAARGQMDHVIRLANYTITRHAPALHDEENPYIALFRTACTRQCRLIAGWMGVGFIHGVMNTDNMTLSGETIDYGPCAFMEEYHPNSVFSSIDHQGRYAYGNQPKILLWNLAKLAEALLPLFDQDEEKAVQKANDMLDEAAALYQQEWQAVMAAKLGLEPAHPAAEELITDYLALLKGHDWTMGFYGLARVLEGTLDAPFATDNADALQNWLARWRGVLAHNPDMPERLYTQNPLYIPRNQRLDEALKAAEEGDMTLFDRLLERVTNPYDRTITHPDYATPADKDFARFFCTYCGT